MIRINHEQSPDTKVPGRTHVPHALPSRWPQPSATALKLSKMGASLWAVHSLVKETDE